MSRESVDDWTDAVGLIAEESAQHIGKNVSAFSLDIRDDHSTYSIGSDSAITFSVTKNLDIILFTAETS